MVLTLVRQLSRAFLLASLIFTSQAVRALPDLDQPLSAVLEVDPALQMGQLENGVRYYIRKTARPEKQAIIQLMVNAGSLNELEHERGLAHYLEHVVFKGSPHFENEKDLDTFFTSRGVQFITDNNAFTTFNKTGYYFVIPTDDELLFQKTFAALGDFAGRAFLREEAINAERPIILDELQMRSSVALRQAKALLPVLLHGSSYPDRLPGGEKSVISNATAATIRNFYETWYTPDNIAVVAVGDLDPAAALTLIKEQFGGQQNRKTTTPSRAHIKTDATPKYGESVFFVDAENRHASLQIYFDLGNFRPTTVRNLRTLLSAALATAILNQRLEALSYQPTVKAQQMGCGLALDASAKNSFASAISVFKEGKTLEGTAEFIAVIKQFVEHGTVAPEIEWAKTIVRAANEQLIANANALPHQFFQSKYNAHFEFGDHLSLASAAVVAQLENRLLEDIDQADIDVAAREIFNFNKAVYLFAFDEKSYAAIGEEKGTPTLREIITTQASAPTLPYTAPRAAQGIKISAESVGGESIIDIPAIEAKKITLANGIEVYYKHANFTENVVNIAGFAAGGIDTFENTPNALKITTGAVSTMGFGGVKPYQWTEVLKDKPGLAVHTGIDLHSRGVSATCRKEDLLFCLNLLKVQMLEPNVDGELFSVFAENAKTAIRAKQNSPQQLFLEKNNTTIFNHPTLFKPLTEEIIEATSAQEVAELYRLAFNNVAEFTFTICGNVSVEEVTELLNKTLASLPARSPSNWQAKPIQVGFPAGATRSEFERKSQEQTGLYISFPFSALTTLQTESLLEVYEIALNKRIHEFLRSDNGKTYSPWIKIVKVNDLFVGQMDNSYRLLCLLSCAKEEIQATTDLVISMLQAVQTNGLTNDEVEHAKKVAQNHLTQAFKNNVSWNLYMLDRHVRTNGQFDSVETLLQQIEAITSEQVNSLTHNLLDLNHYFAHALVAEK